MAAGVLRPAPPQPTSPPEPPPKKKRPWAAGSCEVGAAPWGAGGGHPKRMGVQGEGSPEKKKAAAGKGEPRESAPWVLLLFLSSCPRSSLLPKLISFLSPMRQKRCTRRFLAWSGVRKSPAGEQRGFCSWSFAPKAKIWERGGSFGRGSAPAWA